MRIGLILTPGSDRSTISCDSPACRFAGSAGEVRTSVIA
jgi:hypothetical protein